MTTSAPISSATTSTSSNNNSNNSKNTNNNNNNPTTAINSNKVATATNLMPTTSSPASSAVTRAATAATSSTSLNLLNSMLDINGGDGPRTNTGGTVTAVTGTSAAASRTMQSDEDFNIRFVNLVRQHRCLYDKKVPEYRNRDNQEKSWSLISQETRESVIHCKERWRNLRACLSRYIKQQSGNDPQHKPYYLTEHMAFLLPFLKSTRNSLDGNNSLAQLYQYSQQQQLQNNSLHLLTQSNLAHFGATSSLEQQQQNLELKHSLSENDDEETIDAFDPAVTATLQQQQQHHAQLQHSTQHSGPPLSDTASANSLQNFIPDVQLSEFQTADIDCSGREHLAFANGGVEQQQHHTHHGVTIVRRGSHEFGQHQPVKRIKTECHASEATTTQAQLAMYNCDNSDMEFFRSILPDIAALTPQQKRKFKIGILELIDDVIERYPVDRQNNSTTNVSTNSLGSSHGSKQRRHSGARDWRR